MRVFLVEDDAMFANEMSSYLSRHGVPVVPLQSQRELENLFREAQLTEEDIFVLDLGPGEENGIHFLVNQYHDHRVPCIILTGNDNATDRILALELGADGYIIKTAPPREILARLHAVARQASRKSDDTRNVASGEYWQLSHSRRELISPDGQPVGLTSAEFELVSCLVDAGSDPVSRDHLSQTVSRRPCRPDD